METDWIPRLKNEARRIGFDRIGITSADPPNDYRRYLEWVQRGDAADLWYLSEKSRVEKRGDLRRILPNAQSVLVGAISYRPKQNRHRTDAKYGRYAWGLDYHQIVREKLEMLAQCMEKLCSSRFQYLTYVDTGPILERSLAERAGIGWIGKNTCVMSEETGSYIYLGEILTTLPLPSDPPAINRCGTCTRCIDACPTHALTSSYRLRSDRCISYQTIENRTGKIPSDIARHLDGWIAGCDICQEVCPWNHETLEVRIQDLDQLPHAQLSLEDLADLTPKSFQCFFGKTSFKRIGFQALVRNALTAITHQG